MQKRVEDERLKTIEMITIDKLVPKNHLLKKVDKAIDFKRECIIKCVSKKTYAL